MNYHLASSVKCHVRDIRAVDYYQNWIVTGGSDKKLIIFTYKNGQLTELSHSSSEVIAHEVKALKINRHVLQNTQQNQKHQIFVVIGCSNGHIYGLDLECNPLFLLEHDHSISSIDFIDKNTLVTGSWDGKAIIWDIKNQKKIQEMTQHKYAVTVMYNPLTDTVISGSQNKQLNQWDWKTGKLINSLPNAHNDIIREISLIQQVGYVTCSNDQTLKVFSNKFQQLLELRGHSGFVFAVKCLKFGTYVSGGDDCAVKVWDNNQCVQSIQVPGTVWQLVLTEDNDIVVACSDGTLRVFSTDPARKAPNQIVEQLKKQVLESSSKKSGMSAEEINKLPTTSQMNVYQGKKEGEIRVFRVGLKPQAYMWQSNKWVKIGDVITQGGNSAAPGNNGARKYYHGDKYFEEGQYDYVFDVDDESGVPKTIPFNDGGNPLQAAEKYCLRQGLSKGYIQQIRKFLIANSSRIPRQALRPSDTKPVNLSDLQATPSTMTIQFNDIKDPSMLFSKLKELNANNLSSDPANHLSDKQLTYVEGLTYRLKDSSQYYQHKFDFFEIDTIKKLLRWPKDCKVPVWDLLRAFLKHYQSETLFSGLEAGHSILSQLLRGLEVENKESIYTLILKTLSNMLIHNTNKASLIKYYQPIMQTLREHAKMCQKLGNKNYLYAMTAFIYNYSICIIEKNLPQEEQPKIISGFGDILRVRLELDPTEQNRELLLRGGANILSKYREKYGKDYRFLQHYVGGCGQPELKNDLKLLLQ